MFWGDSPEDFIQHLEENSRYTNNEDPNLGPLEVFCLSCDKKIDIHNMHILYTLRLGWHINGSCLKGLEDLVIAKEKEKGEKQRRRV